METEENRICERNDCSGYFALTSQRHEKTICRIQLQSYAPEFIESLLHGLNQMLGSMRCTARMCSGTSESCHVCIHFFEVDRHVLRTVLQQASRTSVLGAWFTYFSEHVFS